MSSFQQTSIAFIFMFVICIALPAQAIIPAGYDIWKSAPGCTEVDFEDEGTEIPANFFGPNSDPFDGEIPLASKPFGKLAGFNTGDADTVVQRLQTANVNGPGPSNDTIPIQIVALSLVSVEPIEVTYNDGENPELWDVHVGLSQSQQSVGQMMITQDSNNGGAFDAQFFVIPRFTFTRLSDGLKRTLDLGSQGLQNDFTIQLEEVPWSNGCNLPALAIPGINDSFCPGMIPGEGKEQFSGEAERFDICAYPAQPATEHFKCYDVKEKGFGPEEVSVEDQFGFREHDLLARAELCNPVQKNSEVFANTRAHLQCYAEELEVEDEVDEEVAIRNQFGSQRFRVKHAGRLCVPTEKRKVGDRYQPITVPIDHYQCYSVEALTPLRARNTNPRVNLKDQFVSDANIEVDEPIALCAPAEKNYEGEPQHPTHHLMCYQINKRQKQRNVEILNQFEHTFLTTRNAVALCVPSEKLVVEEEPDGGVCSQGSDPISGNPWVVCRDDGNTAWVSHAPGFDGDYYPNLICQELGYGCFDAHGGTCGNSCGYCEDQTSCEAPGNENYDGSGGPNFDMFGARLCCTVHWRCSNNCT